MPTKVGAGSSDAAGGAEAKAEGVHTQHLASGRPARRRAACGLPPAQVMKSFPSAWWCAED